MTFVGFKTAKIPLLIRIRIQNTDPDPGADLNPDPIRIRNTGILRPVHTGVGTIPYLSITQCGVNIK